MRVFAACCALVLALAVPLRAQDMPDLAQLPVLSAQGSLAAPALPDQGFWLDVTQAGLYRLTLDGPGLLGLTDFETTTGRSDGSDRQERLLQDGSATRTGQLDDLFLLPGHAYLIQIAGTSPRGVTLTLDQPLDPATALTGNAIPGITPEAPLLLQGTTQLLLHPDGPLGLNVATAGPPLHLQVLTPPTARVRNSFAGMDFGPGGIFPIGPLPAARIELEAQPAPDGTLSPYLLRVTTAPPGLDETEPGDSDLGPLPAMGRRITGVLLARTDRDTYLFTLDQTATVDLGIQVPGGSRNAVDLRHDGAVVLSADIAQGLLFRPGLTLPPGAYQLDISGGQDKPAPYTVDITPTATAAEGEPDDTPNLARPLAPGQSLRGTLGPGNPGYARFDIPTPGHLWELRGVQGLTNLDIVDGNATQIGSYEAASGALVLRLALPPGPYVAHLRGDGPYALRLTDRGPLPTGVETEPNDTEGAALRLTPGSAVTGDFQTLRDADFYEIILSAPTPLRLVATGPDDGPVMFDIHTADAGLLRAELTPGTAPVSYAATFPAGRHLIEVQPREDGVSGQYRLQLDRTDQPEPDEPSGVSALPGDGLIRGQIGGFDAQDQVFVPLPQGSGTLALACQGGLRSWEVWTYGDETRLARGEPGETVILPYDPDTGGALNLRAEADPRDPSAPYDCRLRFAPLTPATLPPATPHDEATDTSPLPPGTALTGQFDTDRDRDSVTLALPPGQFAGLRCDVPADRLRGTGPLRAALDAPPLSGGTYPLLAGPDEITLDLNSPDAAPFPQPWTCALLPEATFATPAMMGPAAAFTGHRDPSEPTPFDPATLLTQLSGGRPDWLTPSQVTQDLPVSLQITGLADPFRAHGRLGQSADLALRVRNDDTAPLTLHYDLTALADGWRITPATGTLTLQPQTDATLPVTLELPPMQSPVTDPQLRVVASAGGRTTALTVPVTLTATAPERAPHRFWTAPQGLRGGLNPLLAQFGARLVMLDGEPVDDDTASRYAFLHDGAALHTGIPSWFRARQASFALADQAPIAGLFVHLRTTEDRATWPGQLALDLSPDGQTWQRAASVLLTASDLPQVFALPAPITARYARITVPGCRTNPACNEVALSEVGLIAPPDWRLSTSVDLADPALGGHAVWAQTLGGTDTTESPFGGQWNGDLLTNGRADKFEARRDNLGTAITAVIGFHNARAARITALQWDGTADDITRLSGAEVQVSLAGPAGPWTVAGTLPSPPPGALSARLDLPTPVWARAVRLTFRRDATDERALPDRIRIWEDPTAPPLLALWEDDRPDAGYEDTSAPPPVSAPAPVGGPDRDHPAPLALSQTVASSVQLERNADWWRIDLPPGPPRQLTLRFAGAARPDFTATLTAPDGTPLPLARTSDAGDLILTTRAQAGSHLLAIQEPPRSVVITWDTSGSVQAYAPGILAAVRLWSQSLQPGRDRLQLLPFGQSSLLLDDWAETPEQIYPVLGTLPQNDSSDSETALGLAAQALAGQDSQRGIVVLTDAETSQSDPVWGPLLQAQPRIVALSIDSGDATGVTIMQDWASLNGGHFTRVTGNAGLADGLDLAAALFRAPKGYVLTATADELREPQGQGTLTIRALPQPPDMPPDTPPTGGIEVILDASGSMLQRMPDGQRRIAVAHDALAGLVQTTLPEGTPFAFRAFGLAVDACESSLLVPLGPLQRDSAAAIIRGVPAVNRARTAIAASLALAAQDLAAVAPPRVVVLVTDGEETCDGDVAAEIARLRDQGLDLRLTIVGFAIDEAALAASFEAWARAGNGQYLAAGDEAGLNASITAAIAPRFALDRLFVDGTVAEVGQIGLDQSLTLPAGRYHLRPLQTAQGGTATFDLTDGATVPLTYDPTTGIAAE